MRWNKPVLVLVLLGLLGAGVFSACETLQPVLQQQLQQRLGGGGGGQAPAGPEPLSDATIGSGLKEALQVGLTNTVEYLSAPGQFMAEQRLRIPLPDELVEPSQKLRDLGFGQDVDNFVGKMNEAAGKAVPEALDIFVDAVTSMTLEDVRAIWQGENDAATRYFEGKTREPLAKAFLPVVNTVLNELGVNRMLNNLISRYNSIPFVKDISFTLGGYVTEKALDKVFMILAEEEEKIRVDPVARVTDLLQEVFGALFQ